MELSAFMTDIELIRYQDIQSPARIVIRKKEYFIQHYVNKQWQDSKKLTKEEVKQRHPILRWL